MAYIVFHTTAFLNEDDTSSMTAAALKAAGITSVKGYGGIDVPVNGEGYLTNPAQHLPAGMLDKLKRAWTASDGNANTFFNQNIDGTPVKDILAQCPSQQSYGIAKELGLPDGTSVPCKAFTDHDYQRIKYKSGSSVPASDGTDGGTGDGAAGGTADGAAGGTGDGGTGDGAADGTGDGGTGDGAADGTGDGGTGDGAADGTGDWWSFFGSKEFLIGAVAVAGVIALIKTLGNTIKARFRKCAKVLYRMQKDFGTKENGMDMKAVLPGVGSKIMDWLGMLWGSKTGKGKNKGALGLRPFVDNYRYEIEGDLAESKKAFNLIRGAADSQTSGAMNNLKKPTQPNESLAETKVYESFAEALSNGQLNESEAINEFAMGTAIAAGSLALGAIKLAAGAFKFITKDKNGKEVEKEVKVTPKSVREICYSILNVFYGKYFDLERVFKKMGVTDLGDIDKSNVDKFGEIVKLMSKELPTDGSSSGKNKMYKRVETNYNKMVDAYVRIGKNIVDNFEKFSKNKKGLDGKVKELSEKDSNLLVSAKEKLLAELNRQEDGYRNNFNRVLNAIIASKEYAEFTDFIIEKVMPVFKTGLASDADYVLDIVPKKGEYYIVRQTNAQSGLEQNDTAKGNVVLVKVVDFVQSGKDEKTGKEYSGNPKITFERVAILTDPGKLKRTASMEYDMAGYAESDMDRTAFSSAVGQTGDNTRVDLLYSKWLALDPHLAINVPGEQKDDKDLSRTKLYKRTVNGLDEYVYGSSTQVKKEETATSFDEAQNISEDDTNASAQITSEKGKEGEGETVVSDVSTKEEEITDTDADIKRLAAVTLTEGGDLFGEVKETKLTCAWIYLGAYCSPKQLDEKLTSLGFKALDNMIKEKEHIADLIASNKGWTFVSRLDASDISKVEEPLKVLETRKTTSEKLYENLDKISENLYNTVTSFNLQPNQLTTPISLTGWGKKQFLTLPKEKGQGYYKEQKTGVTDLRGNEIIINYYPALINADGTPVDPTSFIKANTNKNESLQEAEGNTPIAPNRSAGAPVRTDIQGTASPAGIVGIAVAIRNIISMKDNTLGSKLAPFHTAKIDSKDSIKAALVALIKDLVTAQLIEPGRGENLGGGTATAESFSIEYDKYFNVAESFMSSFGFNGANKLHVNRTIKAPKSKLTYYALSENAWGDGSKLDPEKYIKESLDNILAKNSTYDEFAKLAKNSHSINLIKIAEDCSYNTALPYNRYQMLTAANPLYEGLVIVRFDKRGKLAESIRLGVKKIYCETI